MYVETRWYSFVDMLLSILDKWEFFEENFINTAEGLKNQKLLPKPAQEFLADLNNKLIIKEVAEILGIIIDKMRY